MKSEKKIREEIKLVREDQTRWHPESHGFHNYEGFVEALKWVLSKPSARGKK